MLVCTLGDLVVDVIVRLDRPLVAGDDVQAATTVGAGGQAANVAAWVVALGGRARFVGHRGDDGPGRLVEGELVAREVELAGPIGGRTGVVVSIVDLDRDRSMASDRGAGERLTASALEPGWFAGCDWLHVSGYALATAEFADAAAQAAEYARAAGARVSLDAASYTLAHAVGVGSFRRRAARLAPDLVFATERELDVLDPSSAPSVVVKRGPRGCRILGARRPVDLPAVAAEAVDATGAGDAFAAGFLVGGPQLALAAGARCVSKVGAMP